MRAMLREMFATKAAHGDDLSAALITMALDEATLHGVLPNRKTRAGGSPCVHYVRIRPRSGPDPFEQVEYQRFYRVRSRLAEPRVGLGDRQRKGTTECRHVVGVLWRRLVSEVTEQLYRGRYAADGDAAHLTRDEAFRRIPKRTAARLWLHAAALGIERDRVEVELLAVAPKREPDREMVLVQGKAERTERFVDARNVFERDDEVEVFVAPGFTPEQCIDAPASVDRRVDPVGTKDSQNVKDALGGHGSYILVAAQRPPRSYLAQLDLRRSLQLPAAGRCSHESGGTRAGPQSSDEVAQAATDQCQGDGVDQYARE